jgi:aspartate racemase
MMAGGRHMRRIGVIGGMGPEATVLLMSRIIAATPAQDDGDHVPMFVDNNPQVPSRIKALIEGTGEDPGPVLVQMARALEAQGAQALAMPCNTAHHYAGLIREAVRIPFIDMVKLSRDKIVAQTAPGARIGLLASPAVRMVGIFDKTLEGSGRIPLYLRDDAPLLTLIRHIKMAGGDADARAALARICTGMLQQGADLLVVACSELSLVADAVPAEVGSIDTLDVLAAACIAFSSGAREYLHQENAA